MIGIPLSRQGHKSKKPPGLFCFVPQRREARPLRALRGGFEGLPLSGQPSPNRPFATAARWRAGGAARSAKNSRQHYFR